jgi:hypothetical protein
LVHANIGFGIASGMFNQPHYLGHTWSAASLWIGAAVYFIASVASGAGGFPAPVAVLRGDPPLRHSGITCNTGISNADITVK